MHLVFCQTWIPERTLETEDKLRSEQGAQLVNDTDNVLIAESGASQLWERQRVQRLASGTEGKVTD